VSNVQVGADGLLANRLPGGTWMDARVEKWVITPRVGETVELNALWYNALAVASDWCAKFDRPEISTQLLGEMTRVRNAFNEKFWNERAGCCFDVIADGKPDDAVRPNQLFAASLAYPVLAPERHAKMLQTIQQSLLTPGGLRTLAPDDAKYRGKYAGDVVARDQAYHQGTAYPWLLGPYIRAFVRAANGSPHARASAREMLQRCVDHMQSVGLGQIPELFDGDAPHRAGGAIASARSVAELLRAYVEDILNSPSQLPIAPKTTQLAPTK
jgi:glycogen debranching enzyme